MFSLSKTKSPDVLEICFDRYTDSFHLFGPFWDIISRYSLETGIEPKTVDFLYNYSFTEDDRKIFFYWNDCFTIYIFNISKFQYQTVYDRLYKICAELNRLLNEQKYFKKYGEYPNSRHEK